MGKTTLLNFVRKRLYTYDNVVSETFNPWLFSSTEHLLQEFFQLIARILEEKLHTPRQSLGRILSGAGTVLSGVSLAVGPAGLVPGVAATAMGSWLISTDVKEMRDRVGEILLQSNRRVVILLDDIDRLDVEETYLIFRLIKLVADFPNTSYVRIR